MKMANHWVVTVVMYISINVYKSGKQLRSYSSYSKAVNIKRTIKRFVLSTSIFKSE